MKLSDYKRIHFIGVGGIGMSALARLCLHEGKEVSGSDRSSSPITDALETEGVIFYATQVASNISPEIDLVVYTEAMSHDQEEMSAAAALGVPMVNYFTALGMVANEYYLVAVSGSHGKTTTTAMLIDIFEEAGLDPSAVVGSLRAKTKSNYRAGKSKYFIVEACEYRRDFLSLEPDILVITNLEHEHVDYYKDLAAVQAAFSEMASKVPEDGFIIANLGDENVKVALEFTLGQSGVKATVVDYRKFFDPLRQLTVPGLHNQMNAAAAAAVADCLQIDSRETETALENFAGTWRRFEYKGAFTNDQGRVLVYDDYGHHPTEVKVTIAGARELYPKSHLTVIFQPHTYTRTKELFTDFVTALATADQVYLLPIYAAREENLSGVSSEQLAEAINQKGTPAKIYFTQEAAVLEIKENAPAGGVVLVLGAGDVTEVATKLVQ
jgi:UDP-N-acetylmuramate--alanine ligase